MGGSWWRVWVGPELACQWGRSSPEACGDPSALVLDGLQLVAGMGGAPELARQLG
ncbi:hypothetical protein [Aeromonas caviae]|uniref:hypothetical protein n=1 Tax=Aeromonas caviae TaxID=648 RepID=UPI001CC4BBF5|nr:hypothetical protein [Aeromonas caviae]GJA79375.1 hypothetical protein KAM354_46110 [Aeromonas caviae]